MNQLFVKLLKLLTNAAWYLLLPVFALVFIVIGYKIWSMGYVEWDIPVFLKKVDNLPGLQSLTAQYQYQGVSRAEAVLKLKVRLTPVIIGIVVTAVTCSAFLLFGIIYQLRKILQSLKTNTPFAFGNIRRLRFIGLFVILTAVVNFLDSLYNIQLLKQHFPQASTFYSVKIAWGVVPFVIGVVVLVLSEIFKQGYELKTDNESFV